MSNEGPSEHSTPRLRTPARTRDPLTAYLNTLHSGSEIAELILLLEDPKAVAADDPGLRALATSGGVDLKDPAAVQHAVVALGRRAEQLGARAAVELAPLEQRDLTALSASLLRVMEAARAGATAPSQVEVAVSGAVGEAMDLYQRNLPPRTEEERRWWTGVHQAVQTRALPAYLAVAPTLNALDRDPRRGLLFRSPLAFAILTALPGLLTAPMPLSTPLVCLGLALFGAFVLHPFWVSQVVEPLRAIAENLAAEEARISRLASDTPWPESALSLDSLLEDLAPILEGARRAGKGSEEQLRAAVSAYLDDVAPQFLAEGRDERAFQHTRRLLEGRLPREYARYAAARTRWEGRLLSQVVDRPPASAVALAILTLPVSLLVSLITPFPPGIDFPLMVMLFAWLGSRLPQILPGTAPSRLALMEGIAGAQAALEQLP